MKTEDDNDKKELLNDITQCAKELLNYCNSILDFSKIESKNLQITNTKFSIEKIINNVISIETPIVKHKELILESTLDDDIPSVVIGDQYRLYRILLNLVSNAIKFTHQGYVKIMISLIAMNQSTAVIRFTIKDSGIGIPKEKQNYIFEKFTRLTLSNTGDHKGIGSGLRIVRLFMKDIEGEIDLLSEPQKGTEFICTIPFKIPLTEDFVEYYEIKDEL
ncbi:MAG: hypothetical protein CMF49_08815 [Legionellales bacterium]|nr:hypothetical protein [Legionellales bacterium]